MSKAGPSRPLVVPPWANYNPKAPNVVDLGGILPGFDGNLRFVLGGPGVPRTWGGHLPLTSDLPALPVAWHEGGLASYFFGAPAAPLVFTPDSAKPKAGRLIQPFRSVVLCNQGIGIFPWANFTVFPGVSGDSQFAGDLARGRVAWLEGNNMDARFDVHFGLPVHSLDQSVRYDTPQSLASGIQAGYGFGVPDPAHYSGGEVLLVFVNEPQFGHLVLRNDFVNSPSVAPTSIFSAIRDQLRLAAPNFGKLGRFNLQLTDSPAGPPYDGLPHNLPYFNAMCNTLAEFGTNVIGSYAACLAALKAQVRAFFNL